jgi:putative membrane protein
MKNKMTDARNDLALTRTVMAADRTLMAWIRTGLSVLSFGFAIYKFLMYFKESIIRDPTKIHDPRALGITLISLGTLCMLFGVIEYYLLMKQLGNKPWRFIFYAGIISMLLGILLLISILMHMELF